MKIDFSTILYDFDGRPHKLPTGEDVTLSSVAVGALSTVFPDEVGLSGADKYKRYELALAINKKKLVELQVEDVTLIKTVIGKAYGPVIVGPAYDVIEGKKKENVHPIARAT